MKIDPLNLKLSMILTEAGRNLVTSVERRVNILNVF
jgi:hypothetical protein